MSTEELQKQFGIIGKSKEIKDLIDIIKHVSQSDISVLVHGESGVGKEVFARAIHGASKRSDNKLVSVNCGAIPEGILESELFGHKKGAFTGAIEDRKGYFEIADEGTLFLDEIGEMPLTTQVKLLRVLETGEFMPIGSERVTKVNVRIIAATNRDLQKEVDAKRFRKDLYFRLKAVTLTIPPLRTRREDIRLLAESFLIGYSIRNNTPEYSFSPDALNILVDYNWPGNVRELKNAVETAAALSKSNIITAEAFYPLFEYSSQAQEPRNLPVYLEKSSEDLDREMIYRALIEIKKDLIDLKDMAKRNIENYDNSSSGEFEVTELLSLAQAEKKAIIQAMKQAQWNKKRASEILEISERTLYRKLKEYEIN